jgi:hypothetical protein
MRFQVTALLMEENIYLIGSSAGFGGFDLESGMLVLFDKGQV